MVSFVMVSGLWCASFDDQWHDMQDHYAALKSLKKNDLVHDFWRFAMSQIESIIDGKPDAHFLTQPIILQTMLRSQFGDMQRYEFDYIRRMHNSWHKKLLMRYKDTDFGGISSRIKYFNWSVSTLGHAYYVARILEQYPNPGTIIELGGGYGNMARIWRQLFPSCVYIIIDLPELLALQYLFLQGSGSQPVHVCHELPKDFSPGIYLIPHTCISEINCKSDLFVSNFALSECAYDMQQAVVNKHFFDAQYVYLTGQLENAWQEGWVSHQYIKNAVQQLYKQVEFGPFQEGKTNDHSYEIRALKR